MAKIVTQSEFKTFKSCRLKHHLQYVELLASKKPPGYFRFGSAIHKGLEVFHGNGHDSVKAGNAFEDLYRAEIHKLEANPDVDLWDEDRDEFEAEIELGRAMLRRYKSFNDSQRAFEIVALEQKFTVNLRTLTGRKSPVKLSGKIDGIVKDIHGNLFLLEHKTAANIDSKYEAKLELDDQVNTYLWAAIELGYPVSGVIYNVLAKWVPHAPALLKSGKLSTDKRQKTTYDLYVEAIAEHNLQAEDYSDMLDYLADQEDRTFLRLKVYRNATEITRIGRELYHVTRDMAKPTIYRNPASCERSGCTVRSLCIEDTPEARLNFRIKTSRHEELEMEESNGDNA